MLANALRVWFVIAVAAFAAGYSSTGYADEPPACPMYECKDITAVWKGSSGTAAFMYHDDATLAPSSQGWLNIFTPQSNFDTPLVPQDVWVRDYSYDACTPWCGRDGKMVWQAPQEVSIPATANKLSSPYGKTARSLCTPTEGGKQGTQVKNPTNKNAGDYSPPGSDDAGGIDPGM